METYLSFINIDENNEEIYKNIQSILNSDCWREPHFEFTLHKKNCVNLIESLNGNNTFCFDKSNVINNNNFIISLDADFQLQGKMSDISNSFKNNHQHLQISYIKEIQYKVFN